MAKITVIKRDGVEREVEAKPGLTVMEAIRDAGIDELLALCGGCCSCATCHVHVEEKFLTLLPPVSANERDLLDYSPGCDRLSRLSCQIPFTPELDGMRVVIAEED